jgi:hypothetical protein
VRELVGPAELVGADDREAGTVISLQARIHDPEAWTKRPVTAARSAAGYGPTAEKLRLPVDVAAWRKRFLSEIPELLNFRAAIRCGLVSHRAPFPRAAFQSFLDAARRELFADSSAAQAVLTISTRPGALTVHSQNDKRAGPSCALYPRARAFFGEIEPWLRGSYDLLIDFHLVALSAHDRMARAESDARSLAHETLAQNNLALACAL